MRFTRLQWNKISILIYKEIKFLKDTGYIQEPNKMKNEIQLQ